MLVAAPGQHQVQLCKGSSRRQRSKCEVWQGSLNVGISIFFGLRQFPSLPDTVHHKPSRDFTWTSVQLTPSSCYVVSSPACHQEQLYHIEPTIQCITLVFHIPLPSQSAPPGAALPQLEPTIQCITLVFHIPLPSQSAPPGAALPQLEPTIQYITLVFHIPLPSQSAPHQEQLYHNLNPLSNASPLCSTDPCHLSLPPGAALPQLEPTIQCITLVFHRPLPSQPATRSSSTTT